VSPVDVVLNQQPPLVVQPDVVLVAKDRLSIVSDRIWGPPDLVVEVLSTGTAARDRTIDLEWYRRYGLGECWLVDARNHAVEVISLARTGQRAAFHAEAVGLVRRAAGMDLPTRADIYVTSSPARGSVSFANRPSRLSASSFSDRSTFACAMARWSTSMVRS
jgi:hypothetical protein